MRQSLRRHTGRLALVVCASLLLTAVFALSAPTTARLTVAAGETVVVEIGDIQVEIQATEDTVVKMSVNGETLSGSLYPAPSANGPSYVTVRVVGPPAQMVFEGVVYEEIMALFSLGETGHTEN